MEKKQAGKFLGIPNKVFVIGGVGILGLVLWNKFKKPTMTTAASTPIQAVPATPYVPSQST